MSTKNSQRRPKSAAVPETTTTASTSVAAAPAPAASVSAAAPAVTAAAPSIEEVPKAPRGSKRKAPSSVEEDVKAEKKQKGSKKAPSESTTPADEKKPSGKTSKSKSDDSKPAAKPRKPKTKPEATEATAQASTASGAATPAAVSLAGGADAAAPTEESNSNPNLLRYLRTLLKAHYPEYTISKEAIQEVQRLVYQFGLHFFVTVKRHLESAKKNTLMPPDVPICLQRVLSGSSLYSEFRDSMDVALDRYKASYPEDGAAAEVAGGATDEKRKQMWAARAGLSIPPTRIKEFAKQYLSAFRFSQLSITALTALLERLAILVFRLSYEKAQELSRKRISQADVQSAVKNYTDLQWLAIVPQLPLV